MVTPNTVTQHGYATYGYVGYSAGPFVILLFLFVKIDLATDSGSEYDRDEKKNRVPFFLTCVTGSILKKSKMAATILVK